jgi:DNA-directed RNA polymerase subunit M/transcription elongation factor TFIIS
MEKCPRCGEMLYVINSSSSKLECLTKGCGYSTVAKVAYEIIILEDIPTVVHAANAPSKAPIEKKNDNKSSAKSEAERQLHIGI